MLKLSTSLPTASKLGMSLRLSNQIRSGATMFPSGNIKPKKDDRWQKIDQLRLLVLSSDITPPTVFKQYPF